MPAFSFDQSVNALLAPFPRGVPGRDKSTPANAQFMSAEELRRYAYHPLAGDRLLLGKIGADYLGAPKGEDRHILLVSGSRSGKGVSHVQPMLLTYNGSILAIDPKGENYRLTGARRRKMGHKVFALAPFASSSARYNPMARLTPDSPTLIAEADSLAEALIIGSGADDHWNASAQNLIQAVILHVATAPRYAGKRTLVTVRQLLRTGVHTGGQTTEGMKALYAEMAESEAADGVVSATGFDMIEKPDNEKGSVVSTARRQTSFLDLPQMQQVLSGHDFELSSLKTDKVSVYLILPAYHMSRCARWLRLFVNLLLQDMEQTEVTPALPVLMILDEFAVLGHVAALQNAAGQIAGFGVQLFVILQDLGQLKSLYGDRYETFIGNSGVLIFFGNGDLFTLDYASRALGQTSVSTESSRDISADDRKKGLSPHARSSTSSPLLTPDEVAQYCKRNSPFRCQLVLLRGEHPALLSRALAYDDPLLTPLLGTL